MKVLYDSGDISAQAYEQVVNGVSMAKLQYDGAKLNYDIQMENSTVTAPISGLLESFDIKKVRRYDGRRLCGHGDLRSGQ